MTSVIVSPAFWDSGPHRCCLASSFERLNLAFFVDRKHKCFVGGIEIKTDHIVKLLAELLVFAEFERFDKVRLQVVVSPNPVHCGLADALSTGHCPGAPMSCVHWLAV